MAIGITFLEKYEPLPKNTICIFDRFGRNVLTYAKVHTYDFGCRLTEGKPDCNGHSSAFDGIAYSPCQFGSIIIY